MALRSQHRELINALEARHESITDHSTSYIQDIGRLLGSDDIPLIQQELAARSAVFDTLQSLWLAVRHEIDALRSKEHQLLNWQQSAVALPVEILETIFEVACVPTERLEPFPKYKSRLEATRAAINLTCSRWREVALHTRGIWNRIFMGSRTSHYKYNDRNKDDDDDERSVTKQLHSRISQQLDRAGSRPLLLYLHTSFLLGNARTHSAAADLAQSALDRCVACYISLSHRAQLSALSVPAYRPLLRTLILTSEPGDSLSKPLVNLTQTPSLQRLWIDYPARGIESCLVCMVSESSSITELHLQGELDPTSSISAINSCPQLVTLRFGGWHDRLSEGPILRPLVHLRNLCVVGDLVTVGMPSLVAPNLTRLCISPHKTWDRITQAEREMHNRIFIPYRFPYFRYLELQTRTNPRQGQADTSFIASHMNLEEVVFGFPLDDDIYNYLSTPCEIPPSLRSVWVPIRGPHEADLNCVIKLVQTRAQGSTMPSSDRPFVVNVTASLSSMSVSDYFRTYPDVSEIVKKYQDGPVILNVRDSVYPDETWDWISQML